MANVKKVELYAFRVHQHGGDYPMFCFKAKVRDILSFTEVKASALAHPKYPQRPLNKARAATIAKYFSTGKPISPAILINFDPKNPPAEVELDGATKSFDIVKLTIDPNAEKAYCIDGQHRLWAFDPEVHEGNLSIDTTHTELSVVAFLGIDLTKMTEQFITINTTQEKVKKEQILTVRGEQNALDQSDQWAFEVVKRLNEIDVSPLKNQVIFFPGEKKKMIKNTRLLALVRTHAKSLQAESVDTASQWLAAYLRAWANIYKPEWEDKKLHMICTAVGLECMLAVFELVNQTRAIMSGDNRNLEAWNKALDGIKNEHYQLAAIGYDKKHISWLKADFKVMASGKHNVESLVKSFEEMVQAHARKVRKNLK